MSKKELWQSLRDYHFEHLVPPHLIDYVTEAFGGTDAFTKAFGSKLCRKLAWKRGFALRSIAEYKKFVFLGVASRMSVTPSKVIDQVWHEHQLFTKAYRDFCQEVICQDFDHYPELVPLEQQTLIFSEQYLDTVDLYRSEFNQEPPADIWAVPKFNSSLVAKRSGKKSTIVNTTKDSGGEPSESYAEDSRPIYQQIDSAVGEPHHDAGFHGFDGGDSGGGGASGSWELDSTDTHHGHSSSHSGHSDSGSHSDSHSDPSSDSGGSDSASSCSSGGSCGSSCGGGGCSSS